MRGVTCAARIISGIGFFFILGAGAHAASFDCSKAKSVPEQLICATPELSRDDDALKRLFDAARQKAQDQAAFREQARIQWNERERVCRDVQCLRQWYARQASYYSSALSGATPDGSIIAKAFACQKALDCLYFSPFYKASKPFRIALTQAMTGLATPSWIPDGTMTPMIPIVIDGEAALIGSICQPHDCGAHHVITIFYRRSHRLVGMYIDQEAESYWLAHPLRVEQTVLRKYEDGSSAIKVGQIFVAGSSTNHGASDEEEKFIAAVAAEQNESQNAINDMQRGGFKAKRVLALCRIMTSRDVSGWHGKVKTLDANEDGSGVLAVEIAPGITLETNNNSFSDMGDHTLIPPGSPVFAAASAMTVGQAVVFSGSFLNSDGKQCVRESSLTLKGGLSKPEFIFRFSQIAAE